MNKVLQTILVIIAGETIFMLPFLIPRLYRPLIIDSWGMSNTDIGFAYSAYGFSAMISYFFGGMLADKYSPRSLISISLFVTGIITLPLIFFPSPLIFKITYFFWGISTILFMWGALIKITHLFGGEGKRASSMGILDAGRGLVAALTSSLLIYVSYKLTSGNGSLKIIYSLLCLLTVLFSIIFWFGLRNVHEASSPSHKWSFKSSKLSIRDFNIWLLGIIVLSAYCGYKSVDLFSIYLVDVHKFTLEKSAALTSVIFWVRPLAALTAGLLADFIHKKIKLGRSRVLIGLLLAGSVFQFLLASKFFSAYFLVIGVIFTSAACVYALRAIYFSIFGDLNTPNYLVGTTVGIVSFIGFLPDMFYGVVTGHLIDTLPNQAGYHYSFAFTGTLMFIGTLASIFLYRRLNV